MSVTITINADSAYAAKEEMRFLLASAPAVYDVSSDTSNMTATEASNQAEQTAVETVAIGKPARRGRPSTKGSPTLEATATSVTTEAPAEPPQAISTGGDRVDPDAAPGPTEASVAPSPVEEAKVYTMDDVRNAATPYIKAYTMAAAQADLQDILEAAVGIRQISKLDPKDQAQMKKAVEAFDAAKEPGTVAMKLIAEAGIKAAAAKTAA